ncbi:hypothetical protein LCGC14_2249760 [marine sediment metagenome]|uniref:Uncharacterized protein n=1 Tax=marine sediment metagenome TaxID=412755 RepID=A0A0F9DQE1_9ZZZZ
MVCSGCREKKENRIMDRRGNLINQERDNMEKHEKVHKEHLIRGISDSFLHYRKAKNAAKQVAEKMRDDFITTLTDDQKRIQIAELIGIFNYEEVSGGQKMLAPSQALAALWDIVHHVAYAQVVGEFKGLSEQVDTKYEELLENKINISWSP